MTWKNEPIRHALASKGVKTSFGKSRYRDMKEQLSRDPDVEEYIDIKPPKELYPNWENLDKAVVYDDMSYDMNEMENVHR